MRSRGDAGTAAAAGEEGLLEDLLSSTFRANPAYTLEALNGLPAAERRALDSRRPGAELYGILRPGADSGLGIKLVDPETARLFAELARPGPIPRFVRSRFGSGANRAVAALVLDEVLQLRAGGGFVSGAESASAVFRAAPEAGRPSGPPDLSLAAIRYAEHLEVAVASELATRLYLYNRAPATAAWRARIPDAAAARAFLGLGTVSSLDRRLDRHWTLSEPPAESRPDSPWLSWRSRERARPPGRSRYLYKLYVSPPPDALPEAFARTVAVLAEIRAPAFKVGQTLEDLLRPDKLVAYFWSLEALQAAIESVVPALHGLPAQGVPFTASAGAGGLVSWGVDPPDRPFQLAWEEPESWRSWIADRLAAALVSARGRTGLGLSPAEYALRRLRLSGVDTESWAPLDAGGPGAA